MNVGSANASTREEDEESGDLAAQTDTSCSSTPSAVTADDCFESEGVLFYDEIPDESDENAEFNLNDFPIFSGTGSTNGMSAVNLSFAGCGFLGIYHLGVALCLARHGPKLLENVQRYAGASAGALVASALAVKGSDVKTLENCVDFVYGLGKKVNKKVFGVMTPGVSLLEPLEQFLDEMMPADAHQVATGRLFVSLTNKQTRKNELVSNFETRDDLIKCLIGTSYIPYVTGRGSTPIIWKGNKYIDGGITDNLPIFQDGRTVLISPFSGRQDIRPTDKKGPDIYVNILKQDFKVSAKNLVRGYHALAPPKTKKLKAYFEKGFKDAAHFLKKEKMHSESE